MPGLFFCAQVEGRASESAGSFGGKNHRDTEYTKDQAISSALLLINLMLSWSNQTRPRRLGPPYKIQQ